MTIPVERLSGGNFKLNTGLGQQTFNADEMRELRDRLTELLEPSRIQWTGANTDEVMAFVNDADARAFDLSSSIIKGGRALLITFGNGNQFMLLPREWIARSGDGGLWSALDE